MSQNNQDIMSVGSVKQLFADDELIESISDVFQVLNPGRKHPANPVMTPDRPWEGQVICGDQKVIYDPNATGTDRFRMWYDMLLVGEWEADKDYPGPLYAHSEDGIHWEKPMLGVASLNGSTENNAVWANNSRGWMSNIGIADDPNEANPERRYKVLAFTGTDEPELTRSGYTAHFSPDGIHWTPYEHNPVIADYDHVTTTEVATTIYNEQSLNPRPEHPLDRHRYYCSMKYSSWQGPPRPNDFYGYMRRAAGLRHSEDFVNWSENHLILQADELDDILCRQTIMENSHMLRYSQPEQHRRELYGMGLMPCGDILLGILWIFDPTGSNPERSLQDGPCHVQLAGSRDLTRWKRLGERMPLLGPGEPGAWDCGVIYPSHRPIVVGDEIWLYYGGSNQGHGTDTNVTGAVGLATWRLDGFVSINANRHTGTVTTRPVQFAGNRLLINAETNSGEIAVELLDGDGTPIAGFEVNDCVLFRGDDVAHQVKWRNTIGPGELEGRPVKLKFYMSASKLYSFTFC
jgi:hypothetical protein